MICPYYKNKEVFDGFNEIVEALGGKPLTEEEFRSAELRNERSGRDFTAMNATYEMYDKNGGNFLNLTPDGKPSLLFQTLLDLNSGDRTKAIVQKSKVYSKNFIDWFGDWINDPQNASKVVDNNGEPLVVYHGTNNKFSEFDKSKNDKSYNGFFFAKSTNMAKSYGNITMPVFLNVREQYEIDGEGKNWNDLYVSTKDIAKSKEDQIRLHKNAMSLSNLDEDTKEYWQQKYYKYLDLYNAENGETLFSKVKKIYYGFRLKNFNSEGFQLKSTREIEKVLELDKSDNSILFKNISDYGSNYAKHNFEPGDVYVVTDPNRIKSATNNKGTFSKTNNDINKKVASREVLAHTNQFERASVSMFGDAANDLMSGNIVYSDQVVTQLLANDMFGSENIQLAEILSLHKIPVKLVDNIDNLTLATTITDNNTGASVVAINKSLINQVSSGYLSQTILHELVHAATVQAINKPTTQEQQTFARLNKTVFDKMSNMFKNNPSILETELYALTNEKEFAAEFITDKYTRQQIYKLAKQLDYSSNGKFIAIFKNFVNSLVNLFINKTVFNTNVSLVNQYRSNFINYLKGVNINSQQQKLTLKEINNLYDTLDSEQYITEGLIDSNKALQRYADSVERNNLQIINLGKFKTKDDTFSFGQIEEKLQIRINALKTADMGAAERTKLISDTKSQLEMFRNSTASKYLAVTTMLRQILPQVIKDIREIKNINVNENESLTGKEYMFQSHSNIRMYHSIGTTLQGLLNQTNTVQQIVEEYNNGLPEDQHITEDDILEVKNIVNNLVSATQEGEQVLEILRDRTAKNILLRKAEQEGNLEAMETFIKNVTDNANFDDNISWFELNFGAMDSVSNDALRALYGIVNRARQRASKALQKKTLHLLELQSDLKFGESVTDLYELDESGKTTGWMIRKLNFGKFYRDYENEIKRINTTFNKMFKSTDGYLLLEDTRKTAPDGSCGSIKLTSEQIKKLGLQKTDSRGNDINWTIMMAWNQLKNNWLNDHCERKYNKKYYDAWIKVPQIAKDAEDAINSQISAIKSSCYDERDDRFHYENLTDSEWDDLQQLWTEKKLLKSDYDRFGNKKEEGSVEYEIAKSLQQLQIDLYGDEKRKASKDKAAWQDALNEVIEQCGGVEEFNKFKRGETNSFDADKYNKWHLRNSRLVFKQGTRIKPGETEPMPLVFQDMEDAMRGLDIDYGDEYNKLKDQRNKILQPYRSQNGEVVVQNVPETIKKQYLEISDQMYKISNQVLSSNQRLKAISEKAKQIRSQFIQYVDNEYMKQAKKEAAAAASESGFYDQAVEDAILQSYGRFNIDIFTGFEDYSPYRWTQRLEAIDKDKYMEYEPGDAWIEKDEGSSTHINKEYEKAISDLYSDDPSMREEQSYIPKKALYDNSKAYNKIKNSKTLWALYKESLNTMRESNAMQTNRLYTDNYLLPQMTGSIWKRMKRRSLGGKIVALIKYISESIGFSYNPDDLQQIGSTSALDYVLSDGTTAKVADNTVHGQYPDGRTFNILPQYFTRRLQDPSQLDSDLINILSNYYKMSCMYKEKLAIRDDCETIVDYIKGKEHRHRYLQFTNNRGKDNVNEAAQRFLEMNLYEMRRKQQMLNIGPIHWRMDKFASTVKQTTTAVNLGANPKVALVGFLTTLGTHILETLCGRYGGFSNIIKESAFSEVIFRNLKSCGGVGYIGNALSNDKLMLCAETFEIANQLERKYLHTNRNRALESIVRNSVYGMLSTVDFQSKSIIMVSMLMSHHYVESQKKFMSPEDIRLSRYLCKNDNEFKKLQQEWNSGKSIYSVLSAGNKKLNVDKKYEEAYNNCFDVVKDRIQKLTEYADGMTTELQRAGITQTIIGSMILIHKQYLPVIVQKYFGNRVYDYDTHEYKNGILRSLWDFCFELSKNNIAMGALTFGLFGASVWGPIGAGVGVAAAAGFRLTGRNQRKKTGERKKSIKNIYKEQFSDFSDRESTAKSYSNRYNIKNIFWLVVLEKLAISPLANTLAAIADDADDDDEWWLQFLAYIARSFEWEFFTPLRFEDMLNNVKSPTAATSVLDKTEGFMYQLSNTISPTTNILYDLSLFGEDTFASGEDDSIVQRGAYGDKSPFGNWKKINRDIFKLTPYHNLYEQALNSKDKRKYMEQQIMRKHK